MTAITGFRRLTRDSLLFGLGQVTGKAMGLVLLPLLVRALSPDDYGRLDVLWSLGSGCIAILLFGLDAAAVRLYFDEATAHARASLFSTWGVMLLAVAIVGGAVLKLVADGVGQALFGPGAASAAVSLLAIVVPAGLVNAFVSTGLRISNRPLAYGVLSALTFVVYGTLVIGLVGAARATIASVVTAWALALAATSLLGLLALRRSLTRDVHTDSARRLIRYGVPLAPLLAATLIGDFANRAILLTASGPVEVAHLTVALRLASVIALIAASFQLAWQPRVYAMGVSADSLNRIATDARRYIGGVAVATILIGSVTPIVVSVVAGAAYRDAIPVVGLCVATSLIAAVFVIASTPSTITKRPGDLTKAVLAGVTVALLLNTILAGLMGSAGTATALLAGQATSALVSAWLGRRRLSLPGPWGSTALVIGTTVAGVIIWTQTSLPLGTRLGAGVTAVAILAAYPPLREVATAWAPRPIWRGRR